MATYEEEYARGAEVAASKRGYEEGYKEAYGSGDSSFNWKGFAEGVAKQGFQWLDREIANDAAVRRQESLNRVELDFRSKEAGSGWSSESGVELTNDQVEQRGGFQGLTTMYDQLKAKEAQAQKDSWQTEIDKDAALSGLTETKNKRAIEQAVAIQKAESDYNSSEEALQSNRKVRRFAAETEDIITSEKELNELEDGSYWKTGKPVDKNDVANFALKLQETNPKLSITDALAQSSAFFQSKTPPVTNRILTIAFDNKKVYNNLPKAGKDLVDKKRLELSGELPPPAAAVEDPTIVDTEEVTTEEEVVMADTRVEEAQKVYDSLEEQAIMVANKRGANIKLTKREEKIQSDFDRAAKALRRAKIDAVKTKASRANRRITKDTMVSPEQRDLRGEIERTALGGGKLRALGLS